MPAAGPRPPRAGLAPNPKARNELTDRILELVPDEMDPETDEAWREDLRRRRAKNASGETKLLAWEDVRATRATVFVR